MVGIGQQLALSDRGGGEAAETALIRSGLAGDRAALERLFSPHKRSLVAFCYGILGNAEDAEDAAQETLLRALRALAGFRGDAAFRSWLYRIALNLCINWKRSRARTEPWEDEDSYSPSATLSAEAIALRRLQLMEALRALPPRHRAVLLLREWEGWNLAEIGAVMGWNEVRVKNELYKARRTLVEARRRGDAAEGEQR
jgi:RNA polymerase sigma-70 factor (ECF subfamily)